MSDVKYIRCRYCDTGFNTTEIRLAEYSGENKRDTAMFCCPACDTATQSYLFSEQSESELKAQAAKHKELVEWCREMCKIRECAKTMHKVARQCGSGRAKVGIYKNIEDIFHKQEEHLQKLTADMLPDDGRMG